MSASTNLSLLCVFCRRYLVDSPRQARCGDRLCGACFEELRQSDQQDVTCPDCHQQIILAKCFRDKAVELELASTTARCPNQDCPWEGQCTHYLDHLDSCSYSLVSCPNAGCDERMRRSDLEQHVSKCGFTPVSCEWCHTMIPRRDKDAHLKHRQEIVMACSGAKCQRRELLDHISDMCPGRPAALEQKAAARMPLSHYHHQAHTFNATTPDCHKPVCHTEDVAEETASSALSELVISFHHPLPDVLNRPLYYPRDGTVRMNFGQSCINFGCCAPAVEATNTGHDDCEPLLHLKTVPEQESLRECEGNTELAF